MKPSNSRSLFRQAGFTLVEIMVGLAIGMLATLVIMQVFSVFEGQKRTTTGTADAQTNGGIALYNIGRELQIAGYPLLPAVNSPLECTTLTFGATGITGISPVTITDGTSDTITIRYGDSLMGGIPTQFTPPATVSNNFGCFPDIDANSDGDVIDLGDVDNDGDGVFDADDIDANSDGDVTDPGDVDYDGDDVFDADIALAISSDGLTCNMTNVTVASSATPTAITLAPVVTGAELACVGRTWNEIIYAVNNGNLQRSGQDTVAGIVNLQAQYGISAAANSNQVTQWVNATGGTWAAPTVANRNRIKAIRIAVVARNAKIGPDSVTASPLTVWNGGPTVSLSAEEQRYRYRVFETIIPLRNVIWSRDTL